MAKESSEPPRGSQAPSSRSVARRMVLSDQASKRLGRTEGVKYLEDQVNSGIWDLIQSGSQDMKVEMPVCLKKAGMTKMEIVGYLVRRGFSHVKLGKHGKSRKTGIEVYTFRI